MSIPDINIRGVNIGVREIPTVIQSIPDVPVAIPLTPPITQQIGTPIMQVPGCVEAREQNNRKLSDDDPKGNIVLCDGSMPSYKPIEYNPNDLTITRPPVVPPKLNQDEQRESDKTDALEAVRRAAQINTAVVADQTTTKDNNGNAQIDQQQRQVIEQPVTPNEGFAEKYLPSVQAVTTTASIAVVATTSALLAKPLADLILKLVKPTVKKVILKIQKMRGKEVRRESVRERILSQRDRNRSVQELKKTIGELKRGLK